MIRLVPESPEQVEELRRLYHTTKDVRIRTRSQMILLAFDGLSAPKIAKVVDLHPVSVRRCIKQYHEEGISGLYDKPRSGRPRTATDAYLDAAIAALRRRPRALGLSFSVWTLDRLLEYLTEQTGITVSDETLRTHLRAYGFSFSRPQHKVSSPDPDYSQKKRRLKPHATSLHETTTSITVTK
jgi:transposase